MLLLREVAVNIQNTLGRAGPGIHARRNDAAQMLEQMHEAKESL